MTPQCRYSAAVSPGTTPIIQKRLSSPTARAVDARAENPSAAGLTSTETLSRHRRAAPTETFLARVPTERQRRHTKSGRKSLRRRTSASFRSTPTTETPLLYNLASHPDMTILLRAASLHARVCPGRFPSPGAVQRHDPRSGVYVQKPRYKIHRKFSASPSHHV